jgi:glycosyltransferase involved in cell wall biosynthesis
MKILHISTKDSDGAGSAALRLHSTLLEKGMDSNFLCLNNSSENVRNVFSFPEKEYPSRFRRLLRKFNLGYSISEKLSSGLSQFDSNVEIFSSPLTDYKVHLHHLVQEADIIHLHWVANFIDYPTFFSNINKPIVWTLHDFNPDQGGIHLRFDKQNLKGPLVAYEHELISIKKAAIRSNVFSFVFPSLWFKKRVEFNVLPEGSSNKIIYHGIDDRIYKLIRKDFSKEFLELESDELVFICIATNFTRKAKGLEILLDSLDILAINYKFTLLMVGGDNSFYRPYIRNIGKVENEKFMALVYSAADAFLSSSYEESFCLSAAEAMFCGLPVISTSVGFMEELIDDGFNGYLVNSFEASDFKDIILKFIITRDQFSAEAIRAWAVRKFALEQQAQDYISLYQKII